jgi:DNA modification methylase
MTLSELKKSIKPIPKSVLKILPENEKNIFSKYKLFPIEILVKADWNYKEDDVNLLAKLLENIKRNGQIASCQVRLLETGYYEVVDGNHRYDAFILLGQKFVFAYDHGVISLTEAQRISIETNETQFKANPEKLSAMLKDLQFEFPDLLNTLPYTEDEFDDLINIPDLDGAEPEGELAEDSYDEELPEAPKTKFGDLYELNEHRLLCGDSTKALDVAKVMNGKVAHMLFTDPPYNVNYAEFNLKRGEGGKNWTDSYCSNWKDEMTNEEYTQFLIDFIRNAKNHLIEYAHYYIWHATTYIRELFHAFEVNGIPYDKVPIQWVKQIAPISWVHYKRKSEPCLFGGKGAINGNGKDARWFGPNNEVNIWEISRDHNGDYIHPTQKPVALAGRSITNSSDKGEIVLDLFLGSGSTMIAADMLERICYGIDYEPKFCDCIVKRFIKYCEDNHKICEIKLNGKPIDISYFEQLEEENNAGAEEESSS